MVGRRQRGRAAAVAVACDDALDGRVREAIRSAIARRTGRDVALTGDQVTAMAQVRDDLAQPVPMLRLVQGDVGSGKTAVAAHALALVARAGRQGAILAHRPPGPPARATLGDLLEELGLPVTLLTGSLSADGRRKALGAIDRATTVVGTTPWSPRRPASRTWRSSSSTSSTGSGSSSARRSRPSPGAARRTSC
jgi:hypothetical protein